MLCTLIVVEKTVYFRGNPAIDGPFRPAYTTVNCLTDRPLRAV